VTAYSCRPSYTDPVPALTDLQRAVAGQQVRGTRSHPTPPLGLTVRPHDRLASDPDAAHLAVVADLAVTQAEDAAGVAAVAVPDAATSFRNLLTPAQTQRVAAPTPVWRTAPAVRNRNRDGAADAVEAHRSYQAALSTALGYPGGPLALTARLGTGELASLRAAHERADWVITLDRNLGIDVSGRLAMRLVGRSTLATEAVSLAALVAHLRRRGELDGCLVVPVDAHQEVFGDTRGDAGVRRCDVILVRTTARTLRMECMVPEISRRGYVVSLGGKAGFPAEHRGVEIDVLTAADLGAVGFASRRAGGGPVPPSPAPDGPTQVLPVPVRPAQPAGVPPPAQPGSARPARPVEGTLPAGPADLPVRDRRSRPLPRGVVGAGRGDRVRLRAGGDPAQRRLRGRPVDLRGASLPSCHGPTAGGLADAGRARRGGERRRSGRPQSQRLGPPAPPERLRPVRRPRAGPRVHRPAPPGRGPRRARADVLDEAHRFARDVTLSKIMKEGRKYGVAVVVASQGVDDFHKDVLGNGGTKVAFRCNYPQSKTVVGFLRGRRSQDVAEALEQLSVGQAYVSTPDHAATRKVFMARD
jgi:hypothetical protein